MRNNLITLCRVPGKYHILCIGAHTVLLHKRRRPLTCDDDRLNVRVSFHFHRRILRFRSIDRMTKPPQYRELQNRNLTGHGANQVAAVPDKIEVHGLADGDGAADASGTAGALKICKLLRLYAVIGQRLAAAVADGDNIRQVANPLFIEKAAVVFVVHERITQFADLKPRDEHILR